jgi:hypothetical protein
MSSTLHHLAAVRASLATSSEKVDEAHKAHSALLVRLSEAEAKSAEAVSLHRAGTIDEATAALRKSIADADAADIRALIESSVPVLAALNAEHQRLIQQATDAESVARREEGQLAASALDEQIKQIEQTLLSALAERFRIHVVLNGTRGGQSLFSIWKPLDALKSAVTQNTPPNA